MAFYLLTLSNSINAQFVRIMATNRSVCGYNSAEDKFDYCKSWKETTLFEIDDDVSTVTVTSKKRTNTYFIKKVHRKNDKLFLETIGDDNKYWVIAIANKYNHPIGNITIFRDKEVSIVLLPITSEVMKKD